MRKLKTKKNKRSNNETLQFLSENLFSKSKIKFLKKNNDLIFRVPRIFSLIENYDESMEFIKTLFKIIHSNEDINLDISNCVEVDMCALFMLDYIFFMLICSKKHKSERNIIYRFSNNSKIDKFFIDAGLSGYINKDSKEFLEKRNSLNDVKLRLLKIQMGSKNKINKFMQKLLIENKIETIIELEQRIREFLNECLEDFGYKLTISGERSIEKIISEWISNSKNHLNKFCEYYCTGSLNYEDNKGICNLVLVNFGETIFESVNMDTSTSLGKETFLNISNKFKYSDDFDEENGIVLAAIQKKVSRLKEESNTRGTGFPQILEFFSELSDDESKSKMTIISGKTQIKFAKKDYIRYNIKGQIYFSDEDLNIIPNRNNVVKQRNKFPGTMISIKFIFKDNHIKKIIN